jgi:deoxyribonuclease-1-like protein
MRWIILLLLPTALLAEDLLLASWNIRIYSTGSRDDTELELIADRLQQYDLIAIQEARDPEVVERTLAILAGRGHTYEALVSEQVGRGVKERYAFLWRPDKVERLDDGQFYPNPDDRLIRPPFWVSFRAGNFDFTLITIHSIFGDTIGERRAEAALMTDVYRTVQDADPDEQDVILLGDFNLSPEDAAWGDLTTLAPPLITGNRYTTIRESAESLYDNFWFDRGLVQEYTGSNGVEAFDVEVFANDDNAASLAVSDHRPIWAVFDMDGLDDDGITQEEAVSPVGEIGTWEKLLDSSNDFFAADISVLSDNDVWFAGNSLRHGKSSQSSIFRFNNGSFLESDLVPHVGSLVDIEMVHSELGWAMGGGGLLKYDGIFWVKIPEIPGSRLRSHQAISVINDTLAWFATESGIFQYQNGEIKLSFENSTVGWIFFAGEETGKLFAQVGNQVYLFDEKNHGGWQGIGAIRNSPSIYFDDTLGFIYAYSNVIVSHELPGGQASTLFVFNTDISIYYFYHQRNFWLSVRREGRFIHAPTAVIDNFPLPDKEYMRSLHFSPGFAWAVSGHTPEIRRSSLVWPDMRVPSSVDFSAENQEELPNVNDVVRQDVYIINNGEGKLRIWGMTLPESTFRFQAATGDTSNVIIPGDSLQVGIVYLPKDHGRHAGTLSFKTNDPDATSVQIQLIGATRGDISPQISLPESIDFGDGFLSEPQTRTLAITNQGTVTLEITSIGSNDPTFHVTEDAVTLKPDSSHTLIVRFIPTDAQPYSGELTIRSNDPVTPTATVLLTGQGLIKAPQDLALPLVTLDFNLLDGDQEQRLAGGAVLNKVFEVQLNIKTFVAIKGWSIGIEYVLLHHSPASSVADLWFTTAEQHTTRADPTFCSHDLGPWA